REAAGRRDDHAQRPSGAEGLGRVGARRMTRVLLLTGKGGVGKTTVAAATALRCGEAGRRTLVLSTDAAHSLADALGRGLDSSPLNVAPSVWAQELDAT